MKVYNDIRDMLCDELEEIAKKKELTSSSLDVIYRSVDVIKDIATIKAMEEEYPSEGYSKDGYSQGYYPRYPMYMYDGEMSHDGHSYARKRDAMGRYSRDGHEGYSGDTREELRHLMDRATNDRERDAIRKALDNM